MYLVPSEPFQGHCLRGCEHVEISDVSLEMAHEDAKNIKEQKGMNNPSTRNMSNDRDIIGSLGQNSIIDLFERWGMAGGLEMSPYFNAVKNNDDFDFKYRGDTFDVKSSPMRKFKHVTKRSTFLVSDHQDEKRVDYYCFAQVDLENRIIHYPGVIRFDEFWNLSKQAVGDWLKSPAHIISAQALIPIEEIMI